MTVQLDVTTRNDKLDAVETSIGPSPILRLREGAPPANVAAADTGAVVAEMTLPANWLAAAAGGSKAISGTWEDLAADVAGTIGHFRIYTSGGTARMQGTVTITGGGGDMTIDIVTLVLGQPVRVVTFTLTEGNA